MTDIYKVLAKVGLISLILLGHSSILLASILLAQEFLPSTCSEQMVELGADLSIKTNKTIWTMQCQSKAPIFDVFLSIKMTTAPGQVDAAASYFLSELLQNSDDVAFQGELIKKVGNFSAVIDQNWLTLHFGGLSENAEAITEVVEKKLRNMTITSAQIEHIRSRAVQWIDSIAESSEQAAMYVLDERLYPSGGEMAHLIGSKIQLRKVNREKILRAFESLGSGETIGYFHGPAELLKKFSGRWGYLPRNVFVRQGVSMLTKEPKILPKQQISSMKSVVVVPGKNRQNASVVMGFVREFKQIYSYELLEAILSGYTSSRLNQRLREEKAMTYGVTAAGHYLNGKVYFKIQASTDAKMVGALIKEIKSVWNGLVYDFNPADKKNTDEKEFIMAQKFLKSTLPVKFQTADSIGRLFFIQKKNGLDLQQLNHYNSGIDEMTSAQFKSFLEKDGKEVSWFTVVAGPEKEINEALKESGISFDKVQIQ